MTSIGDTRSSQLQPLTYDYTMRKIYNKFNRVSEITQKLLLNYSLTDFENLDREVKVKSQDQKALQNMDSKQLSVHKILANLLINKTIRSRFELINQFIKEKKYEEVLKEVVTIPFEWEQQRNEYLTMLAKMFIKKEESGNASIAIYHLPNGPEKETLIRQCPNYKVPIEEILPSLSLNYVLQFFKNLPQNEKKQEILFKEWSIKYSLDDCKKLIKETDQALKNLNGENLSNNYGLYIRMINMFAQRLVMDKRISILVKEKKYKEALEVVDSTPNLTDKQKHLLLKYYIHKYVFKDLKSAPL